MRFNMIMQVSQKSGVDYGVRWRRLKEPFWFPSLMYVYLAISLPYLVWRTTIINWNVWYGVLTYLAEAFGILMTGLFLFVTQKVYLPIKNKVELNKIVDVLIPTYSEPLSVLEPVVIGAKNIRGVSKVFILDDGNRKEVKKMAKRLKVGYLPRTTNLHAKAGNLNNGLKHTTSEFIITLDADHIPIPEFLEETLGYFEDPNLAFVQSPQTFYNTNSFLFRQRRKKKAWSEQIMFYDCIQPAKNNWNSAFFVGTSAIIRRSAIDELGGFATGTATEDIHTSLKIHAAGWNSIFLPKPLAYGLEAENFKEFYKQRKRWAAGSLGLLFRSPDSPLRVKGLTLAQRLNYVSACLAHLQGVQKACFFITPIVAIFTLQPPIQGEIGQYGIFFAIYFLVSISITWAYSRGTYHPIYTEAYSLASMMAHFGGVMGVIKVQKKFAVSIKTKLRKNRTWMTTVLWGFYIFALVGLTKALYLFLIRDQSSGLIIYSSLFIVLNAIFLMSFLLTLFKFERNTTVDPVAEMKPNDLYEYIMLSFAVASIAGMRSVTSMLNQENTTKEKTRLLVRRAESLQDV